MMIRRNLEKIVKVSTQNKITILVVAAFFLMVVLLGGASSSPESNAGNYPYLANRLFEKESNDLIINFTQLREVMKARHAEKKLPVGIYFEYLPTGSSIGVNDQFEIELGSLAKVPAIMAVYKSIEAGDLSLETVLKIKPEHINNLYGSLWKSGAGAEVKVSEAIELALVESDNTAINVLLDSIPEGSHEAVFSKLDLPKTTDGIYPVLSPKSFASVFRNLFLSSYLDYSHSNNVLETLTRTNFVDKIPAGLPADVKMAHKIGVFQVENQQTVYNDCGIVYVPDRPYLLCIMSATDEMVAREEMIAYSMMVYSYVSQVQPSYDENRN